MDIFNTRKRLDFGFAGDGTQMVGLALFIILLAFFIMLSGMSGFSPKRAGDALDSVREAFGSPSIVYYGGDGRAIRPGMMVRAGQGTSLDDIAGRFEHEVPGLRAALVRRTGVLQIDIPINQINQMTGIEGNGSISPALKTMAEFLSRSTQTPYNVRLTLNYRAGVRVDQKPMAGEAFLPLWTKALVQAGIAPERLRTGIRVGQPGAVTLTVEPVNGVPSKRMPFAALGEER